MKKLSIFLVLLISVSAKSQNIQFFGNKKSIISNKTSLNKHSNESFG
jgi:LAS superfamily LD-carboxypeptidase LdcB